MASNVEANPGSGGAKFRTDDVGGSPSVHVPTTKLITGAAGVDGGFVGVANGLPVRLTNGSAFYTAPSSTQLPSALGQGAMGASLSVAIASDQSDLPVSGTVAVSGVGGTVAATQSGTWTVQQGEAPWSFVGAVSATQSGSWTVGVTGTVAVSGTFWQSTQPVSVASLPLPTGAATETTLAAASAKLPATLVGGRLDVNVGASATLPVSGTVGISGTVPVSGTFFQATQPVSGAVAVSNFPASQSVTGTFFQATQPISAAALPLPTGAAAESTLAALSAKLPAALVSSRLDVNVGALPTLTKGAQGATGITTQPLRDAGRVYTVFTATAITCVTVEALVTMIPYRDLVAGGGATTFAVTAGKRLRLTSITVTCRATSTVAVHGLVRVRFLAGTVLVTSPVHLSVGVGCSNITPAVIGHALSTTIPFPDGLELSGTMQLGCTQLFSAATATVDVQISGFEY